MKRSLEYRLQLPKTVRIDDVDIGSIPIDDSWRVTVKDGDRKIGEMSMGAARAKLGRGERHG
jgi:hypothetical protein